MSEPNAVSERADQLIDEVRRAAEACGYGRSWHPEVVQEAESDLREFVSAIERRLAAAEARIAELEDKLTRWRENYHKETDEAIQSLGKALGYPECYPHFSSADDGRVCVAEAAVDWLAEDAAKRIAELEEQNAQLVQDGNSPD